MTGIVEISEDDFRRYAIRSKANPDVILAWTESRKLADQLSRKHIVTRTPDGMRIFPPEAITKTIAVAHRNLLEARVG